MRTHDSANRLDASVFLFSRTMQRGGIMLSQLRSSAAHLEAGEVARYLAKTLSPADRETVEHHLADCAECTAELVAVSRLHRARRAPVRRVAAVAAAAAVVAGIVLLGPGIMPRHPSSAPQIRGAESQPAVRVVLPADGAVLRAAPDFTWRAVPGATAYRVSVSRASGDSVWATTTSDTNLRGSAHVARAGSGLYYWYVDVLLEDARSIAGPVHEFRIEP
jgi:hypothetical protein